nr:putative IQ motif and ankyrin repeat domain-containing protein LOC642574 homolog isoform X2 [Zootoca vivipara]
MTLGNPFQLCKSISECSRPISRAQSASLAYIVPFHESSQDPCNRGMSAKKAAAAGKPPLRKGAKPAAPAKGVPVKADAALPSNSTRPQDVALSSHPKELTREVKAALTLQSAFRRILACRERARRLQERQEYNELMDRLQREAFAALVKREREEAERERKKEEEEKKKQREEQQRRKRMLEAAFDGDVEEMKAVLKEVADLDTKSGLGTDEGAKALRLRHHLNMVDCTDANGNTPLSEASGGGHPDAIRMLIENGANPNSRGAFNRTPLYRAAFGGHLAAVELLLQHGADPRLYADDGNTPEQPFCLSQDCFPGQLGGCAELLGHPPDRVHAPEDGGGRAAKGAAGQEAERSRDPTAIADAESLVETLRVAAENAEEKVSLARLKLREQMQEGSAAEFHGLKCSVQELDDVLLKDVGGKIHADGRWPLIIDPSGQAAIFLRYRDTNFLNTVNPSDMAEETIRLALLGSLRYGKPLVFDMMEVNMFDTVKKQLERLKPGLAEAMLDKKILQNERYLSLRRPTDGPEYAETEFQAARIEKFKLFIVTKQQHPPEEMLQQLLPIQVILSRKRGFRRAPFSHQRPFAR